MSLNSPIKVENSEVIRLRIIAHIVNAASQQNTDDLIIALANQILAKNIYIKNK